MQWRPRLGLEWLSLVGYFAAAAFPLMTLAAAATAEPLSLRAAVQRGLDAHALLEAARARIAAAQGQQIQAGLRPNPRLSFQTENVRTGGNTPFQFSTDTDDFLYLSQTFEMAGKRTRRLELANASAVYAERERDQTAFQIASRIAAAYWSAAGAARVRDLLRESVDTFERIVQYHRDRVREGAAAEADLIRVQLEQDRFEMAAQTAAQDAERARIALYREMGVAPEAATRFTDEMTALRTVDDVDAEAALSNRPEILTARQAVERARANLRLQRAYAIPDPEVLFGYKRTVGLNTMIGGVQIELPLASRNQGAIAAGAAEVRAAEAQLRAAEMFIRAEIEAARRDYQARRKQIDSTLEPLRRRAAETQAIAQAAYREGGTDLLRLLDAERTRLEAEVLYFRTLADYQLSVITLETALGRMP